MEAQEQTTIEVFCRALLGLTGVHFLTTRVERRAVHLWCLQMLRGGRRKVRYFIYVLVIVVVIRRFVRRRV